jgi:hypothetical protein
MAQGNGAARKGFKSFPRTTLMPLTYPPFFFSLWAFKRGSASWPEVKF